MDNWGGQWPEDFLFANNIFFIDGSADFAFGEDQGTVFTNNLYSGDIDNQPPDGGAIFTDPGFVGPLPQRGQSGFDILKGFMLQKDSQCLQTGVTVGGDQIRDFFGNRVNNPDQPSIGIHEPEPGVENDKY